MDEIIDYWRRVREAASFIARWQREVALAAPPWLSMASTAMICAAYLLIVAVLVYYVRKRRESRHAGLLWLFGLFIFMGGMAHFLALMGEWQPAYWHIPLANGLLALVTLVVAGVLIPMIPKLVAMRNPVDLHREIAQRRRTEMELRQVHAQLEGVIELRTSELASKNEEMEQFLNTVSHDLKNPVVTCLGLIGVLREDVKTGRVAESLDSVARMERSVTRMRQLIDDLLNLSRIGRVRFELSEVDTLAMIRSIEDEMRPRLLQAGAVLEIAGDLPGVTADERWLSEVFENLITNAIKYGCDNTKPRIAVGCAFREGEIHFFVRDNGRGIDPAHHAQIFEPFRRLRSDKEGSGMGLAIVVRIIKMHGGRVWIESQLGQGATFWIAFPKTVYKEPCEKKKTSEMLAEV